MPASDPSLDRHLQQAKLRISYPAGRIENGHDWPARDALLPLAALSAPSENYLYCIDWAQGMDYAERARPAQEVAAAAQIRADHAPAQLREVMTQFWHDHFNVNSKKDEFCAAFFPSYDAMLRANAFGDLRSLLGQVARAPAMLYYLNNADSRATPATENFARELLELHTLGAANYLNDRYDDWQSVPKDDNGIALGYLDLDVYEVAPNRAPLADGEQVLDLLARHPATAQFVCRKIAVRLLADSLSDGLVDALAQVFLSAADEPDQIAKVIRALVIHPKFSVTPPSKMRRPFEFLARFTARLAHR